jgi:hypothetical protein
VRSGAPTRCPPAILQACRKTVVPLIIANTSDTWRAEGATDRRAVNTTMVPLRLACDGPSGPLDDEAYVPGSDSPARCSAGLLDRERLCAVVTNAMWENA